MIARGKTLSQTVTYKGETEVAYHVMSTYCYVLEHAWNKIIHSSVFCVLPPCVFFHEFYFSWRTQQFKV